MTIRILRQSADDPNKWIDDDSGKFYVTRPDLPIEDLVSEAAEMRGCAPQETTFIPAAKD